MQFQTKQHLKGTDLIRKIVLQEQARQVQFALHY
jgi:hypothetical protein